MCVQHSGVEPDRVMATMKVRPDLCATGDTLHGGAMMAFADTLGALARS
jgi:acyl-coenzyme A thioesterase PaaI-like protein